MLYKATTFDTKDINKSKRTAIIKYASYGTLDRDNDMATKGMFTKSWNESPQDIRFFLNHDKKLTPGRPQPFSDGRPAFWEDNEGAYAQVYMGTHTLGEDVLKMMDEGIITNNSYGFDPIKSQDIKGKGKAFKEVKLWEVSCLTHWGAHPDSLLLEVNKAKNGKDYFGRFNFGDEVYLREGSEHNADEKGVLMLIVDQVGYDQACYALRMPDGTRRQWYAGNELVPADDTEPDNDIDDEEVKGLKAKISHIENALRNSSVSDDTHKWFEQELKSAKEQLSSYDTAATSKRMKPDASVNKEFADALALLTLLKN